MVVDKTIMKIEPVPGLRSLSSTVLGRFLSNRDNNLKYISLNTLQEVVRTDLQSVQKHKNTILECLKEHHDEKILLYNY
jgi:AP-1 complex subunit gamma-1